MDKDKSKFVSVDWFEAHKDAQTFIQREPPERKTRFSHGLWPVAEEYYSPLNPIFITEKFHPSQMNQRAVWLARDGLVPLLWFFKKNPDPASFRNKILVHEEFAPFVPQAWRAQTGAYRLQSDPATTHVEPHTLLVTGLITDSYCSHSGLLDLLDRLEQRLTMERIQKMRKYCFLPVQLHSSADRQSYQAAFFIELFKRCGADFQSVGINWVEGQPGLTGTVIVDLNEMLLCADNALMHLALQRGARYLSLTEGTGWPGGRYVPLSPYHGIVVTDQIGGRCEIESDSPSEIYFSQFQKAMRSHTNRVFPWPSWINEWGQAVSRHSRELRDNDNA